MPRPLTFTSEIAATILGARRVGAPLRHCAKAAGIPWRTFCDWLNRGRDGAVTHRCTDMTELARVTRAERKRLAIRWREDG